MPSNPLAKFEIQINDQNNSNFIGFYSNEYKKIDKIILKYFQ